QQIPWRVLQKRHQFIEIYFLGFFGNGKPVNDSKNSAAPGGQELEDAHTDIAQHKPIDSQNTQEDGNKKQGGGVFQFDGGNKGKLFVVHSAKLVFQINDFLFGKIFLIGHHVKVNFLLV